MEATCSSSLAEYTDISCENNYGNCRCCLVIGQHSQVIGKNELQMLMDNLNISLVSDKRLPRFICTNCVSLLNDVQTFRQKVLASEVELLQIFSKRDLNTSQDDDIIGQTSQSADPLEINVVKLDEVKIERSSVDRDLSEDNISTSDIAGSHQNESSSHILECKIKVEQLDIDYNPLINSEDNMTDKTISIVSTSKIHLPIAETERKKTKKRKKCCTEKEQDNKKKSNVPSTLITIGDRTEPATDNTKLRANIVLILQNSTVFPFRSKKANCFKCFYCEQTCGLFGDLKDHVNTKHKNGATDYTIFKWLQSRNKKIIHADISELKCKLCCDSVSSINELVEHLMGVHNKVYYGGVVSEYAKVPTHGVIGFKLADGLKCHLCQTDFRFLRYLISHMIEHYGCFPCPNCNKKFVTSERLNEHCKTHEQTETKCTDCNLVFTTRRNMLDHRYLKHIKKKRNVIKCTECPLTFPTTRPILRFEHMEKEHGIKRPIYKCHLCQKTYQTIHGMNHHTRSVHVRKNEFMCDICGYVTTEKTVMTRHIDHHNGVRKYECDICHKKFRTKGTLRLHLRGHFNDKRFACSLCEAKFIQKHCLKSHIKSRHPDSGIDVSVL